ncbi:MAG: hypothetical protein GY740_08495 [Gammaproteobacteria bacterium]|nr:hypothetical protein [Gammaproteobacteria bacterium]
MNRKTGGYIAVACMVLLGAGISWRAELGDLLNTTFVRPIPGEQGQMAASLQGEDARCGWEEGFWLVELDPKQARKNRSKTHFRKFLPICRRARLQTAIVRGKDLGLIRGRVESDWKPGKFGRIWA